MLLLREFSIPFDDEKKLLYSRSRVDFEIQGSIYVECKVSTNSTQFTRAMGQVSLYKAEGKEVWIVVPDDVDVRKDQREILEKQGVQVLSETMLQEKLSGKEPLSQLSTKTTVACGVCKCCGKINVTMSRSPSNCLRSYCVSCEDEVKQRVFDGRQDRWIKVG